MLKEDNTGSVFGGILLVAGTCIGAGMLAIPLVTGLSGFFPAIAINVLCWLFMLATGLLFLEATLWMPDGSNVLSMADRFLGKWGKILSGFFFLFLYYCLMVSYLSGASILVAGGIKQSFGIQIPEEVGFWLFACIIGAFVFIGAHLVDKVNWILMTGLVISYLMLLGAGADDVQANLLVLKNWKLTLFAAPVLFGAYGFHNIIPTISTYLRRDRKALTQAIFWGTVFAFVIYSFWQWLIMGSVSMEGLAEAALAGKPASQILSEVTGNKWVSLTALYFGFFALVTSLLGVSLSMVDFFGDGFKIENRTGIPRFWLTALVFFPPALFAFYNPGIFVKAIGFAGGFGEAFLNGLLPISMVWIGRYKMKLQGKRLLFGGRGVLLLLTLFCLLVVGIEAYSLIG